MKVTYDKEKHHLTSIDKKMIIFALSVNEIFVHSAQKSLELQKEDGGKYIATITDARQYGGEVRKVMITVS